MEPKQERSPENAKKKRFLVVKLEDRIVPAHLPTHAVIGLPPGAADAPGIEVAGEANHKAVEFKGSGSASGVFTNHNETLVRDLGKGRKTRAAKRRRRASRRCF
jgi:hypothetical protein